MSLTRVTGYSNRTLVWWLLWNISVLTQTKITLSRFLKKGKENMVLTEVHGSKVSGFWLEHKWGKYLEQIYDMLSIKVKSWSQCRGRHYIQFKVEYELLLEYWLLSGIKRLHLFKPCWQGDVDCSSKYPETLKA